MFILLTYDFTAFSGIVPCAVLSEYNNTTDKVL